MQYDFYVTACNLFPSHSCIGWPKSSPNWDSNLGPRIEKIERRMTYQLNYPSPLWTYLLLMRAGNRPKFLNIVKMFIELHAKTCSKDYLLYCNIMLFEHCWQVYFYISPYQRLSDFFCPPSLIRGSIIFFILLILWPIPFWK